MVRAFRHRDSLRFRQHGRCSFKRDERVALLRRAMGRLFEHRDKLVNEMLVSPTPPGLVRELLEGLRRRKRKFVWPCSGKRVVNIDSAHDLREEWHASAAQPIRISRAIEPLMVVADDRANTP